MDYKHELVMPNEDLPFRLFLFEGTGLALLASYVEEIKIGLLRLGETVLNFTDGRSIEISKASFSDFMVYYDVTLMNPKVLAGMFLGSMIAFMSVALR